MHFILLFLLAMPLWAHQTSLSSGGNELYWTNKNVPLMIQTNTSDMSATQVQAIIRDSMAQWNAVTSAQILEASSSDNQIKFVSNFPYGSAVLGVTELNYNTAGAIKKGVISINDDYFYQASPGLYPTGEVFLGDVVTHEMGHLFGMAHSEVLNSTMFYSSFSGQSTVAFDDQSGIRQKYDSQFGTISGTVLGGDHVGVLGVHVQAISRRTGESSGAISDENGDFILGGLTLDDTYYLYTSPIKNPNSLPGQYSNIQSNFCPASYVGSFFNACGRDNDGKPQGINLTSTHKLVDVGVVTINCSLKSDPDYDYEKVQSSFSPLMIYEYSQDQKYEKAFVGWFHKKIDSSWSAQDLLTVDLAGFAHPGTNRYLKVSLVSFPMGAQLQYQMTISKNGSYYSTDSMSYNSTTETYNPDLERYIPLDSSPSSNNFEIGISSKKLENYYLGQIFPNVNDFTSDTHMPYLIMTSIWEMSSGVMRPLMDTTSNLSDNGSCLDAPLTYAITNAQNSNNDAVLGDGVATAASCGTIEPPSNGPGSSLPLLVLGFVLALMPSILAKSRKKFLS